MKKIVIIITVIFISACGIYGCTQAKTNFTQENQEKIMTDKKVLVAYYSYSGNTTKVAEKIKKLTGGDIFEIVPETAYSSNYNTVVSQAQKEKAENFKPKLKKTTDITKYDVIFIGTPVWWYTMASPVRTFVAENNFDGKIISPFCTHGGGGASQTYSDIQKLAQKAKVTTGYTSYEKTATDEEISAWIKNINK